MTTVASMLLFTPATGGDGVAAKIENHH